MSGDRVNGGGFMEHFRLGPDGRFAETQYHFMSHEDAYALQQEQDGNPGWGALGWGGRSYYPAQSWQQPGYPAQQPGYPPQQQGYPGQRPRYPAESWQQPGYSPGWQQPLPPQPPPPRPTARGLFAPFANP